MSLIAEVFSKFLPSKDGYLNFGKVLIKNTLRHSTETKKCRNVQDSSVI